MTYMTGILPIAKYSSGSELNMFTEFTMATPPTFSDYFGFCESEVDDLYGRYLKACKAPVFSREALRSWYDEIFSAMIVYGFLSYKNGKVSIPNKELMGKFADMLMKEPSLGYVNRLAKAFARMLKATLSGDTY